MRGRPPHPTWTREDAEWVIHPAPDWQVLRGDVTRCQHQPRGEAWCFNTAVAAVGRGDRWSYWCHSHMDDRWIENDAVREWVLLDMAVVEGKIDQ